MTVGWPSRVGSPYPEDRVRLPVRGWPERRRIGHSAGAGPREADVDIHEYQAKELLARFGVPVLRGGLAYSPEQAAYRAREIGGEAWVVKAQIHSGGRGKAGGVKLCRNDREIEA